MPRDPRRSIPAVDVPTLAELGLEHLARVRPRTRLLFVLRPVAVAALASWLAAAGRPALAVALVPLWYGWSLTLVHHMIHGALGAGPRARHLALAVGGLLALHSGHALLATHLQHHATGPDDPDPEGRIEAATWRRMPVEAVRFRYRLWAWGWRHGGSAGHRRAWSAAEMAVHAAVVAWALSHPHHGLALVAFALWGADAAFAVLAGKGPQTNWGRPTPTPLIAVRSRWTRWLLLAHNWHLEHHLYPQLPLPALAEVAPAVAGLLAERGALVKRLP